MDTINDWIYRQAAGWRYDESIGLGTAENSVKRLERVAKFHRYDRIFRQSGGWRLVGSVGMENASKEPETSI